MALAALALTGTTKARAFDYEYVPVYGATLMGGQYFFKSLEKSGSFYSLARVGDCRFHLPKEPVGLLNGPRIAAVGRSQFDGRLCEKALHWERSV